jgi:hypothetical protein
MGKYSCGQALLAEVAATPKRKRRFAADPPGFGLDARVHLWPSQRRIRVLPVLLSPPTPTA